VIDWRWEYPGGNAVTLGIFVVLYSFFFFFFLVVL
jgi:hypothetical protein